jgi:F1F0 ATPase subunit 2
MMSDIGLAVGALAAGIALGALFFGGLWWTVRRGLRVANPALWFGVSGILRMALMVSGLYYVARAG